MKTKPGKYDIIINCICLLLLLIVTAYLAMNWSTIPAKIPGHYNALGEVDRWGNKNELLLLPILAWVMYLGLTLAEQFPKSWNTGVAVTEENIERVYKTLRNMIGTLKLIVVADFLFITLNSAAAVKLPVAFLPVALLLEFGAMAFFIVKLKRIK